MDELFQRLAKALQPAYQLESELGGGGMSRVFLARETDLGRQVVIKVLPPEMAADVNRERFQREIRLAASLQHPHIVPLLTAGATPSDLLYYVMPYIEGESLRTRLSREGELPIEETARILREVTDALQYAHAHSVIHRDIKPDNVLLTTGHAVVTDFGVAKAVSASTGAHSSITSHGVALGTPTYMSPEQAAADPHVDQRADIYALGVLGYEMLTGRPPFVEPTPQQVLAAHVSQAPMPVGQRRDTIPPVMAELVMRCLAKRASDRWQTAGEVKAVLDAMATPASGGMTPTGTQPVPAVEAARHHPRRAGVLFALGAAAVLGAAWAIVMGLGLPTWVFIATAALLAVGFPVVLLTGHHEHRRAITSTTGLPAPTPTGVHRHLTWQKAALGGGIALALLVLAVGAYTGAGALGVGPGATLMTRGVLSHGDTLLLVAEFENRTPDSTIATTVKRALEIDLAGSPVFNLVPRQWIETQLTLMRRAEDTPLTPDVAREMGQRLGLKAIVTGAVDRAGEAYVLSATLESPEGAEVYATYRETADSDRGAVDAIARLSNRIREEVGESLRSIRSTPALRWATTNSLDALRLYTSALRERAAGRRDRAIQLMEEAVTVDTTFAAAYRMLSVTLNNLNRDPARERYHAIAFYYMRAEYDLDRAIDAYRTLVSLSDDRSAGNNLMVLLNGIRRYEESEEYGRALLTDSLTWWGYYSNTAVAQIGQGQLDEADSTIGLHATRVPGGAWVPQFRANIAVNRGDYDTARRWADSSARFNRSDPSWQRSAMRRQARLDFVTGRLASGETRAATYLAESARLGDGPTYINNAAELAYGQLVLRGDTAGARARVDEAVTRFPLRDMEPDNRPYIWLNYVYSAIGDTGEARRLLGEYRQSVSEPLQRRLISWDHASEARIARAEGRTADAIRGLRDAWDAAGCVTCLQAELAELYDAAGEPDSAIAAYERALYLPDWSRMTNEAWSRGTNLGRLGNLYEERGDRDKAIATYDELLRLWSEADAELQPLVADTRDRLARLVATGR